MGDEDTEKLREEGFFFHIDFDPFKLQLLWPLSSHKYDEVGLDQRVLLCAEPSWLVRNLLSGLRQGAHDLYLIEP